MVAVMAVALRPPPVFPKHQHLVWLAPPIVVPSLVSRLAGRTSIPLILTCMPDDPYHVIPDGARQAVLCHLCGQNIPGCHLGHRGEAASFLLVASVSPSLLSRGGSTPHSTLCPLLHLHLPQDHIRALWFFLLYQAQFTLPYQQRDPVAIVHVPAAASRTEYPNPFFEVNVGSAIFVSWTTAMFTLA